MRKVLALFAIAQCFTFSSMAQYEIVDERKSSHYVGLQANQLIRQIFNFSNAPQGINNPYLLTYAVNSNKTGVGFTAGFGYTFSETNDGDQFIDRITTNNDLFFRFGIEKKS